MTNPAELKYTRTHEWVRLKGKRIVVGVTEYALHKTGEIIGVDLPEPGESNYEPCEEIGVIEAAETCVDFHAPVAGRVVAINTDLLEKPEWVSDDPYGKGWLIEMEPENIGELRHLMNIDKYEDSLPQEE